MILLPYQQRLYIRAHPFVFWVCVGLTIIALVGLVAPSLLITSPAAEVLPGWLRTIFYASYALGAAFSVLGQVRGAARWEASGMMLLATAFVVQLVCGAYLLEALYPLHKVLVSSVLTFFFALGAFMRSRFLMRYGYPRRVIKDADALDARDG